MIKTANRILLLLSILVLLACGGIMGGGTNESTSVPYGSIAIEALSTTNAKTGDTVTGQIYFGRGENDYTGTFTAFLIARPEGETSDRSDVILFQDTATFAFAGDARVDFSFTVDSQLPKGVYTLIARRQGMRGRTYREARREFTVDVPQPIVTIDPDFVRGARGQTVASLITVNPVGTYSGTIRFTPSTPDVIVTPATLTFAPNSTVAQTAQVTYTIPANSPTGSTTHYVNYEYEPGIAEKQLSLMVSVSALEATFEMSVTPSVVHISGVQALEETVVTLTPVNGFVGNVTLNFDLPGNGSLTVSAPAALTMTVPITSGLGSVRVRTRLKTQQVPGGTAPIGTATVTATSPGIARTASFNVTAS